MLTLDMGLIGPMMATAVAQQVPADNAKASKAKTPTAQQQANRPTEIETSRRIRQAIVADKALSSYAYNVKVVTRKGEVTLKGPVRTSDEKAAIEVKVVNQLEVVPAKTSPK
jgi:osmotically-inducible protein OsmY